MKRKRKLKTPEEQVIDLMENHGVKQKQLWEEAGITEPTFRKRLVDGFKPAELMRLKAAGRIKWRAPRGMILTQKTKRK